LLIRIFGQSSRFVKAKPVGAAGLLTLLIITMMAVFADHAPIYDPLAQDIPQRLTSPNGEFFFGTDRFGRDMFSRVIYGARMSLLVGISSVALSTLAGILIGIPSGYFGGRFDLIVQRFIDSLMAFPTLVLALMIVAAFGTSVSNVILALFVALTPRMTRIARGEALSIRHEPYVLASHSVGSVPYRVMFKHILPNSLAPIIVMATGYIAEAIVAEASLSFLGLGVPPPDPSWGRMLQEGATEYLQTAPWLTLFPGIALSLVIFSVTIFGDALRDVLDPKLSSLISKRQ
jgi:peptide/nickel transport system permease protein